MALGKKGFLCLPGSVVAEVRDRSELDTLERSIEYVSPEELDLAIRQVLEETHGAEKEEIPTLVARKLGLARTGSEVRQTISKSVRKLVKDGRASIQGGFLEISSESSDGVC